MGRAKWLKKPDSSGKKADSKKKKDEEDEDDEGDEAAVAAKRAALKAKREQEMIDRLNAAAVRGKAELMDVNMTVEVLDKKVNELVSSRGKKGTDSKIVHRHLEVLAKIARVFGPEKEIPVLMHLISSMFDQNKLIDDYLDLLSWRSCYRYLYRIMRVLHENKKFVLSVLPNEDVMDLSLGAQAQTEAFSKKRKDEEDGKLKNKSTNLLKVTGSLESYITRLEEDYTRSLQQINPHTQVPCLTHVPTA